MMLNTGQKIQKVLNTFHAHHLLIFFVPFLIYMSNGREISSGDPIPTVFVAINIAKQGTIFLDDIQRYIDFGSMPFYVSEQKGHIVSNYPVFPGMMASPIFAPFVWMGMIDYGDGDLVWRYLAKLSGALFTSLSVYFMYLTLALLISKSGALILAYTYGLGTALWPVASQSLWQHGPSVLWWTVSFYALIRAVQSNPEKPPHNFLLLAGTAAGCAVLCRTVNGVGAAWLCLIMLVYYRQRAFSFIIPASLLTLALISYNVYIFDSWKGGDSVLHTLQWELDRIEGGAWSTPLGVGLAGQLISPSRGIFIFSPFLIFGFAGMFTIWRKPGKHWRLIAWTIPIPIIMLLLFSKYSVWWGGNSHYGPRYQIEVFPYLFLYLSGIWPVLIKKKLLKFSFVLFIVSSLTVQFIGAFCYPSKWTSEPTLIWQDKDRYWDYSYNQIITCAKSGIKWPW